MKLSIPFALVLASVMFAQGQISTTISPTTSIPSCGPSVSSQCPPEDGANAVYLEDPKDCSKYCQCSSGVAFSIECSPGLLYNPDIYVCDWPDAVNCGTRPNPLA